MLHNVLSAIDWIPYAELGLKCNEINRNISVDSIINGNNLWCAGTNSEYITKLSQIKYFKQNEEIKYFKQNDIKIKKICANIGGCCMFWITDKHQLYVNGKNNTYQLGLPQKIDTLSNVIDVSGGSNYSIALCLPSMNDLLIIKNWIKTCHLKQMYIPSDIISMIKAFRGDKYAVYARRYSYGGMSKSNNTPWTMIDKLNDKEIIQISCVWHDSLFLDATGSVWSVGYNRSRMLGHGHNYRMPFDQIPMQISYFITHQIKIKQIASGMGHVLALDVNGNMYGWGDDSKGQIGDGCRKTTYSPKLFKSLKEFNIVNIKCGAYHSYSKSDDNKHFLWGNNRNNQCSLCALDMNSDIISKPFCINDIFCEITNGLMIINVYLGDDNTFIIAKQSKQNGLSLPLVPNEYICYSCAQIGSHWIMQCTSMTK